MIRRKNTGITAGFMTQIPSSMPAARSSRGGAYGGCETSGVLDESRITSRSQSTALGIGAGDRVQLIMQDTPIVFETAPDEPAEDPAVAAFLDTLEDSIHTAAPFPVKLMERVKALTEGIEVDLDAAIEGDVVI